jgi:hypothetical protein
VAETPAHDQTEAHRYTVHYPPHPPRTEDPHYVDFEHFHRQHGPDARCRIGLQFDDGTPPTRQVEKPHRLIGTGEVAASCDVVSPIELHHAHVEFSLQQGIDLAALERDYPGISDPHDLGAWVETGANFEWLCVFHHRGHGGAHVASASDFEAERYVRGLIS